MQRRLSELHVGESGTITKVVGTGEITRRIVDLGLTEGVCIKLVRTAPLGDPLYICTHGFQCSLRKKEAALVYVNTDTTCKEHTRDSCRTRRKS